jgi:hypothetical protein
MVDGGGTWLSPAVVASTFIANVPRVYLYALIWSWSSGQACTHSGLWHRVDVNVQRQHGDPFVRRGVFNGGRRDGQGVAVECSRPNDDTGRGAGLSLPGSAQHHSCLPHWDSVRQVLDPILDRLVVVCFVCVFCFHMDIYALGTLLASTSCCVVSQLHVSYAFDDSFQSGGTGYTSSWCLKPSPTSVGDAFRDHLVLYSMYAL